MLNKLKNIKIVLVAWKKTFLDFLFRDIIKYNSELIERATNAEQKVDVLSDKIKKLESEYAFELNAEMNTKVRVWLKTNGYKKQEISEINSMTNIALEKMPKQKYEGEKQSFDRDYRNLQDGNDGLSKSKSK